MTFISVMTICRNISQPKVFLFNNLHHPPLRAHSKKTPHNAKIPQSIQVLLLLSCHSDSAGKYTPQSMSAGGGRGRGGGMVFQRSKRIMIWGLFRGRKQRFFLRLLYLLFGKTVTRKSSLVPTPTPLGSIRANQ